MYRHGDLLIVRVERIPGDAKLVEGNVLALGEATGHAHLVEGAGVEMFETADSVDRWLRITSREQHQVGIRDERTNKYSRHKFVPVFAEGSRLVHEEHGAIVLPPGEYQIIRQREYRPKAVRYVAD